MAKALILPHIFLGRLEKPILMNVLVKQSAMAQSPNGRFTSSNGKLWVRISRGFTGRFDKHGFLEKGYITRPLPVKAAG